MTKTFDQFCNTILSEMGTTTPAPSGSAPNQQYQKTPSPNNPTPQPTQPNQQTPPINDDELLKVIQQKLQDQKFQELLMQQLKGVQQPNAANKPAPVR